MAFNEILLHVDMKGSPLSKLAVDSLINNVNDCIHHADGDDSRRCIAMMVEHEDHFPWAGELCCIRSTASNSDLTGASYVPLVQTLGHLEYVLKHPAWRHLRENVTSFADACPLHAGTRTLVREMLRQTLAAHLPSQQDIVEAAAAQGVLPEHARLDAAVLHVGLDEVFSLGSCARCREWIEAHDSGEKRKEGPGKQALFLYHALWVLQTARDLHRELWHSRFGCSSGLSGVGAIESSGSGAMPTEPAGAAILYPGLRCLMWHDMLSHMSDTQLSHLASVGRTEVVLWSYGQVTQQIPQATWGKFQRAGLTVWGASAWRGASQPDAVWTPTALHASNHVQWHSVAADRAQAGAPLKGMVLTGWSRFCGAAALCDTAAAGWPSLYACTTALIRGSVSEADVLRISARYLCGLSPVVWLASTSEEGARQFEREIGALLQCSAAVEAPSSADVPMSIRSVSGSGQASVSVDFGNASACCSSVGHAQAGVTMTKKWRMAYLCMCALDSYGRALDVAHGKRRLFCPPFVRAIQLPYVQQVLAMYEATQRALQAVERILPLVFACSICSQCCSELGTPACGGSLFSGGACVAEELLQGKLMPLLRATQEAVAQLSGYLTKPGLHGLPIFA